MGQIIKRKDDLERRVDALAEDLSRADPGLRREMLGRLSDGVRGAPERNRDVDGGDDAPESRFDNFPV